jgi:hypothetical protein
MPNFGGVAYKANPKATTGRKGVSPYDSTTVQKPDPHTHGSFNPAMATENITAASTKGEIRANPGARTARGAKPFA